MQHRSENITIDDQALVRLCQQGDSDAMGRLIVKYQDRIYNTILKICQNYDDAAELTQDTFVKVLENINSFRSNSSFYTWLFRVAVNHTLNYCKRRFKLSPLSLDAEIDQGEGGRGKLAEVLASPDGPDPAVVAQQKELTKIVINNSFMQSVLVNYDKAVTGLCDDIAVMNLYKSLIRRRCKVIRS